jgi:hypothetical protein
MPPARNPKVHDHWHIIKENSDPKKVRELSIKIDFKGRKGLQLLQKNLHREPYMSENTFEELQKVSKNSCEQAK